MAISTLLLLARIKAEIAGNYRFTTYNSDSDIAELINHGQVLSMDEELIHDMICTANRKGKYIPVTEMKTQMENYLKVVRPRGYPFGFHNLRSFQEFQGDTRTVFRQLNIPTGQLRVHGSSLRKRDAHDLDLLAVANSSEFRQYQCLISPKLRAEINSVLHKLSDKYRLGAIDLLLVEDGTYFPNRPYLNFS